MRNGQSSSPESYLAWKIFRSNSGGANYKLCVLPSNLEVVCGCGCCAECPSNSSSIVISCTLTSSRSAVHAENMKST